jgi:hypothetical protein
MLFCQGISDYLFEYALRTIDASYFKYALIDFMASFAESGCYNSLPNNYKYLRVVAVAGSQNYPTGFA